MLLVCSTASRSRGVDRSLRTILVDATRPTECVLGKTTIKGGPLMSSKTVNSETALEIRKTLAAPIEKVFEAWTDRKIDGVVRPNR